MRALVAALLMLAVPLAAEEPPVSGDSVVREQAAKQDTTHRRSFVGSPLFMLANAIPDNSPPKMAYVTLAYRLTPKDVLSLEFKTWQYGWPIGIPYGRSFEAEGEGFPGHIREHGVSVNYQRFVRGQLFVQVDVMPAFQTFVDEGGTKIDTGFQLFNTYSVGYQVTLLKGRVFFHPSIAMTHRPYQSRMPEGFQQVDDRWPRVFYGQPGLHVGYNF